ncbi:MAG: hypothetical protein ACXU9K_08550 [Thermodesulfobacteriota bacterium]
MSILSKGEKVHVLIRREYELDIRLRSVGEVVEATDTVVRLRGYAFVFDTPIGKFMRSAEQMERIVSLVDSGNIIHVIPREVKLEELRFVDERDRNVLTDGKSFSMTTDAFGARR